MPFRRENKIMMSRVLSAIRDDAALPAGETARWRRPWGGVIIFLIAGLLLIIVEPHAFLPARDALLYLKVAAGMNGTFSLEKMYGETGAVSFPPLLIWILVQFEAWGVDPQMAGTALCMFFGAMTAVGTYRLTGEVFERADIGFFGGLLAATLPAALETEVQILRDSGYWCMFVWSFSWMISGLKRGRMGDFAIAGLLAAIGILFRKEAVELPVYAGFLLGIGFLCPKWCDRLRFRCSRKRILQFALLYCAGLLCGLLPWVNFFLLLTRRMAIQ